MTYDPFINSQFRCGVFVQYEVQMSILGIRHKGLSQNNCLSQHIVTLLLDLFITLEQIDLVRL